MSKRIALALIVTLALEIALSQVASPLLASLPQSQRTACSALIVLITVFVGACIAKADFVLPSVLLWAVCSLVSVAILFYIGISFPGHLSVSEIAQMNWILFAATLLATVMGATLGRIVRTKARPTQV